MYNRQLNAFICTADMRSFSKAAEMMYISPPALIQQINTLEEHIGVPLFIRTHHGITLTDAGSYFYQRAKEVIRISQETIEQTRLIAQRNTDMIRIGTSLLNQCRLLPQYWSQPECSHFNVQICAQGIISDLKEPLPNLCVTHDMIEGVFFSKVYQNRCNFLQLGTAHLHCIVASDHPLMSHQPVTLTALHGYQVGIMCRGRDVVYDQVRDLLEAEPEVEVFDIDWKDVEMTMSFVIDQVLIVTPDILVDAFPKMQLIKMDWDYPIPYGLVYSRSPSPTVQRFVKAIQDIQNRMAVTSGQEIQYPHLAYQRGQGFSWKFIPT